MGADPRHLKRRVRELLVAGDLDAIARVARERSRVLGLLVACTFDRDREIGWRAVEAMGVAAGAIAPDDPASVREHLRRLHWLVSEESGGVCWHAPGAMAAIVQRRPDLFGDYVPIVVTLLIEMAEEDLERFRAGVLWAIGRLGALAAEGIEPVLPAMTAALEHPDPQVRGMAAWSLAEVGRAAVLHGRPALTRDEGVVTQLEGGALRETTVRALVARALAGGAARAAAAGGAPRGGSREDASRRRPASES
jgi:hypothetical protein